MVWIKDWQRQVTDQVGPARAATIFEEGIFVVSTGSNDYVNNYYLNILLQEKYNQDQYRTLLLDCTIGLLKVTHCYSSLGVSYTRVTAKFSIKSTDLLGITLLSFIQTRGKIAFEKMS